MRCTFCVTGSDEMTSTIEFLYSIGVTVEDKLDLNAWEIEVEFINTPAMLEFFTQIETVSIIRLTSIGISFFLTDLALGYHGENIHLPLIPDLGNLSGILFCPMSNVKSINTFGRLRRNPKHPFGRDE